MTALDWIIIVLHAPVGRSPGICRGFSSGRASLAGFAAGAVLGGRLGPRCSSTAARASPYAPLFGLARRAARRAGCSAPAWRRVGHGVRRRRAAARRWPSSTGARRRRAERGAVALGVAWIGGAVALQTPGPPTLRDDVQRSAILRRSTRSCRRRGRSSTRSRASTRCRGSTARRPTCPRRRAAIARDPQVAAARRASCACWAPRAASASRARAGSRATGIVVTNAHVVAGQDDTTVAAARDGPPLDAQRPRVRPAQRRRRAARRRASARRGCRCASDPAAGTAAAILGFPQNGPFQRARRPPGRHGHRADPGRLRQRAGPPAAHVAARACAPGQLRRPAGRRARAASSTTVFAATLGGPAGGYGVPNEVVRRTPRAREAARRHRSLRPLRNLFQDCYGCPTGPRPGAMVTRQWPRRSSSPRSRPWGRTSRACCRARSRSTPERGRRRRAGSRGPSTSSPGRSAISSSSPSPTSTTTSYKKWRMADLPIVPRRFKLVVRDERSQKQMSVVRSLLSRDDVDLVVNACDAGREGELIFAYLYEKAQREEAGRAAVAVLDDEEAMRDALRTCARRRAGAAREAAQSRSEADWIVGMNATRAATIRLRSSFDGAVSLGRVQTPTLAILARREEEIRAFVPEDYWLVDARFETDDGRRLRGPLPRRRPAAAAQRARPPRPIVEAVRGRRGRITKLDKTKRTERAPLLYDLTSLQREANTRYGFSAQAHAGRRAALLRGAQGAHLSAHELAVPDERHGRRRSSRRPRRSGASQEYRGGRALRQRPGPAAAGARRRRRQGRRPPRDHPDEHRPRARQDERATTAASTTWSCAGSWPSSIPTPCSRTRAWRPPSRPPTAPYVFRTRGRVLLVPGWRGVYGELSEGERSASEEDEGRDQQLPKLERGEEVDTREVEALEKRDQAAAALLRRLAARRDGDRGQARRRRRGRARP